MTNNTVTVIVSSKYLQKNKIHDIGERITYSIGIYYIHIFVGIHQ